jgi:hypothetical protein
MWTEFIWLCLGTSESSCEHDNEPSASTKTGMGLIYLFPEQLLASQRELSSMKLVRGTVSPEDFLDL